MRGDEGHKGQRQRALRIVVTVLALALGTVAVWLMVTSDNAQRTKVGALAGFWALLVAAYYPVLGIRHPQQIGQELDVRPTGQLERTEDAAQRLEYERRLQLMVRHEIQQALGSELSHLRSEVAALRSEILEKVGGQIRLERIETTRMIGSDIEALQHEVRQLKVANRGDEFGRFVDDAGDVMRSVDDTVARQLAAAEAEHAARVQQPEPLMRDADVVRQSTGDAFAAMPRLGPFADVDVDDGHGDDQYSGRRRSPGEAPVVPGGRHAGGEAEWASARPGSGRRHRDDDGVDILAEILRREGLRK